MTTDLQKILSVSGEPGLYRYLSQGKGGIIAESLATKVRKSFGMSAKVTSLSDISIYTDENELPLRELFIKMSENLGDEMAPNQKMSDKVITDFFVKVVPTYDRDRFYLSHMKKIVQWYNLLKEFASLDFVNPEEEKKEDDESKTE